MELVKKSPEKFSFIVEMNPSLANAIRRSINEVSVSAIDEADIYKNDSVLYDELIAHRLGLIPIKNQKLKDGETVEFKLKMRGNGPKTEVLSGLLGEEVVFDDMPIVILEKDQELELIARVRNGKGITHAKFSPGIMYYKHMPKIKISGEAEKNKELAELFPEVFSFDGKLKVKDALACDLDEEDTKHYPGLTIDFDHKLVCNIESWGQMDAKDMFIEACKALKDNLSQVSKEL